MIVIYFSCDKIWRCFRGKVKIIKLNEWFNSYWENQLEISGLTDKDINLWKERRRLDKECSVEEEIDMICKCNFKTVKCVYAYQKFAVIVAIK